MKLLSKLLDLIARIPPPNRELVIFVWGMIFGAICITCYWLFIASLWFIPST